jgi:hypothetical protein
MGKSKVLRSCDAEQLVRLTAEAYECSSDPKHRAAQLVSGLCEQVGARFGSACHLKATTDGRPLELVAFYEGGHWTPKDRRVLADYSACGDAEADLVAHAIADRHRQAGTHNGHPAAVRREDVRFNGSISRATK